MFCDKHDKKPIEYNCRTCRKVICDKCHAVEHRGDVITDIDDGVRDLQPQIDVSLGAIQRRRDDVSVTINTLTQHLETTESNAEDIKEAILRKSADLIEQIQSERDQLLAALTADTAQRSKALQFDKHELEYYAASLDSVVGWTNTSLSSTQGASLLRELYTRIMPRLRTVLDHEVPANGQQLNTLLPVFVSSNQMAPSQLTHPLIGRIDVNDTAEEDE